MPGQFLSQISETPLNELAAASHCLAAAAKSTGIALTVFGVSTRVSILAAGMQRNLALGPRASFSSAAGESRKSTSFFACFGMRAALDDRPACWE